MHATQERGFLRGYKPCRPQRRRARPSTRLAELDAEPGVETAPEQLIAEVFAELDLKP